MMKEIHSILYSDDTIECGVDLIVGDVCLTHIDNISLVCVKKEDNNNYPNNLPGLEIGKVLHNCRLQSYTDRYIFWTLNYDFRYSEVNCNLNYFMPLAEWREQQINSILDA